MTLRDAFDEMAEIADAAACDDGNVDCVGNCARKLEIIAVACAVAVH